MFPEYEQYWRTIQADPDQTLEATNAKPTADEIRYAEFACKTTHYVLSRTVSELDWPIAHAVSRLDAIRALRDADGGVIYVVGAPCTISAFLDDDLLDELRLTVHPVLIGAECRCSARSPRNAASIWSSRYRCNGGRVRLVYRRGR